MAQRLEAPARACGDEAPQAPTGNVLEEHTLDRILRTEGEDVGYRGRVDHPSHDATAYCAEGCVIVPVVPIHLRAAPGDYADACLLPGDPLRARWIAEHLLEGGTQVNGERGLMGFTGTFEGRPVSVQATGMGTPSAAIVVEELIELGVSRLLRVGTCGALQPDLALGDLVLALSAVPGDGTTQRYLGGEPHAPTADWELLHGAVHAAKEIGQRLSVGPIASSDAFYDPDTKQNGRWAKRGVLAVEMEAAAIFTIAAMRGVHAGCLLVVSDLIGEDRHERIGDEQLAAAIATMAALALKAVTHLKH